MLPEKKYSYEEWMIRLEEGLTEDEQRLFDNLPSTQPKLASEIAKTLDALRFIKENVSGIPDAILNEDERIPRRRNIPRRLWTGFGVAAATCVVAIAGFFLAQEVFNSHTTTEIVRQDEMPRTKRLEDGSLIRMNSGTQIKIAYSEEARYVELQKGEAHFEVAKQKDRPFIVGIDRFEIRAVGTSFNVRRQTSEINVLVIEGKVELTADQERAKPDSPKSGAHERQSIGFLEIGEKANIRYETQDRTYDCEFDQQDEQETSSQLQWREALLTFGGPTLKDLAEEFEQKTGIRMILRDPRLENIHIVGGVFSTNNPYLILNILKKTYGVPWEQVDAMTIAVGEHPPKA